MTSRRERFEILIHATPEEVWRCLTTSDGIAAWFGTDAEIDLRIGGIRRVAWGDGMAFDGEIRSMEPFERLEIVYMEGGAPTGAEEWLITNDDGATRLTLINSMSDDDIEDWEGFYGDIRRGWRLFMESMRFALEEAEVVERRAVCAYLPTSGTRRAAWETLVLPAMSSTFAEGMTVALVDEPHSVILTRPDRSLLLDIEGSGPEQVLFAQAAAHRPVAVDWTGETLARLAELGEGSISSHESSSNT